MKELIASLEQRLDGDAKAIKEYADAGQWDDAVSEARDLIDTWNRLARLNEQ